VKVRAFICALAAATIGFALIRNALASPPVARMIGERRIHIKPASDDRKRSNVGRIFNPAFVASRENIASVFLPDARAAGLKIRPALAPKERDFPFGSLRRKA